MKNLLLILATLFVQALTAQPCYVRLTDASGISTDSYQQELEAAACSLRAVFPAEFQQSFKVFDFGFYLHHPVTTGYPQIVEVASNDVATRSPYYLLFCKQTDPTGVYTKFWVDLKLPDTGKFGCIDLLSPTLRGDIKKKIEYVATTTYAQDGNQFFQYARAEKAAMAALQKIVADFVECCDMQARNAGSVNACNAFLFPADLQEVTYSGEYYIEMKQDEVNSLGESVPFPKPHFLANRSAGTQSPVASVSGFNITASAVFNGNEVFEAVKVRGKGETQVNGVALTLDFSEQVASQDANDKKITANLTSGQLPYMAALLEDFEVKWEMKVKRAGEPEGDWEPVGASVNDWYLTLSKPVAEDPGAGYHHFHTLFDISCRHGKGASDIELIAGVWEYFNDNNVKRADGDSLFYYKQWSGGNLATNTSELLQRKDGMCMAWARFLLDVFKVHGFQEPENLIYVKPRKSQYMLIRYWENTVISGTSGNSEYPFKNTEGNPLYLNSSYNWIQKEVTLKSPSTSQNNKNPQSDFGNHIFVKIKGKLYDPSYGETYGSSKTIPDPLNPSETIEAVLDLDNHYISGYTIKPVHNAIHFIQMNQVDSGDVIMIDSYSVTSH